VDLTDMYNARGDRARHLGADVLGLGLVSNFAAGVAFGALNADSGGYALHLFRSFRTPREVVMPVLE
jgi:hypothetical protein